MGFTLRQTFPAVNQLPYAPVNMKSHNQFVARDCVGSLAVPRTVQDPWLCQGPSQQPETATSEAATGGITGRITVKATYFTLGAEITT